MKTAPSARRGPNIVVLVVSLALADCASPSEPRPKQVVAPRDVRAEIVAASIYGYEVNSKPCPCPTAKLEGARVIALTRPKAERSPGVTSPR